MNRHSIWLVVVSGLLLALALVAFVAPHASSSPDGLEKVAADQQIDTGERFHPMGDGPLADYAVDGIDDSSTSTVVAGSIGVAVVFGATLGLTAVVRRSGRRRHAPVT